MRPRLFPTHPLKLAAPSGQSYYFNRATGQSVWERPVELLSPAAMADPTNSWMEHTRADGDTYCHNTVTKESTWTVPQELKAAREGHAQRAAVVPAEGPAASLAFFPAFAFPASPPPAPSATPAATACDTASPGAVLLSPQLAGKGATGQPFAPNVKLAKVSSPIDSAGTIHLLPITSSPAMATHPLGVPTSRSPSHITPGPLKEQPRQALGSLDANTLKILPRSPLKTPPKDSLPDTASLTPAVPTSGQVEEEAGETVGKIAGKRATVLEVEERGILQVEALCGNR